MSSSLTRGGGGVLSMVREGGVGGEGDGLYAAGGVEKRMEDEGIAVGEVGEWGDDAEVVADADKELTVADIPEVLAVVVEDPLGAGEDAAGRKLEEESVNVAVFVGGGIVGDAADETAGVEGDEEMGGVDVIDGEHGAAAEERARGYRLETQRIERDTDRGLGPLGKQAGGGEHQQNERRKGGEAAGTAARSWGENRHSVVSVLNTAQLRKTRAWLFEAAPGSCLALLFHRRERLDNGSMGGTGKLAEEKAGSTGAVAQWIMWQKEPCSGAGQEAVRETYASEGDFHVEAMDGGGSGDDSGGERFPAGADGADGRRREGPGGLCADSGIRSDFDGYFGRSVQRLFKFACGKFAANHPISGGPAGGRPVLCTLQREHAGAAGDSGEGWRLVERGGRPMSRRPATTTRHAWIQTLSRRRGLAPVKPLLDEIDAVKSKEQLAGLMGKLQRMGVDAFFGYGEQQDFKDASKQIASAGQGGLGFRRRTTTCGRGQRMSKCVGSM